MYCVIDKNNPKSQWTFNTKEIALTATKELRRLGVYTYMRYTSTAEIEAEQTRLDRNKRTQNGVYTE